MNVQRIPAAQISAVSQLWQELEQKTNDRWLACSWMWTQTWLKQYGNAIPHFFVVGKRGDEVRAIALLTRSLERKGPFTIKALHLGTAGEAENESVCVEHNRILAFEEDKADFAKALVAELEKDPDWDELVLDGVDPEEFSRFSSLSLNVEEDRRVTRIFDFAPLKADEPIRSTLSKNTKEKFRVGFKKSGDTQLEWASTKAEATSIFGELMDLHQKRWIADGKSGAFANDRFRSFHEEMIERLLPADGVFLCRARGTIGTLGCIYGFIENKKARFYQSGLAQFEDNRVSPGFLALLLCMEECRKRGCTEFDFLDGDYSYKRQLSNAASELVWGRLQRSRSKFKIINFARKVRRRLPTFAKA